MVPSLGPLGSRHGGRHPEVDMSAATFDPDAYKRATTDQWQTAAEPWHRWGPTLEAWQGQATGTMLDMAAIRPKGRAFDGGGGARGPASPCVAPRAGVPVAAAGAGGQTLLAARRAGPDGRVLATDISPNILA